MACVGARSQNICLLFILFDLGPFSHLSLLIGLWRMGLRTVSIGFGEKYRGGTLSGACKVGTAVHVNSHSTLHNTTGQHFLDPTTEIVDREDKRIKTELVRIGEEDNNGDKEPQLTWMGR